MQNIYLKSGFLLTRVLFVIIAVSLVLMAYLLVGHIFHFVEVSQWVTFSSNGDMAVWFFSAQPTEKEFTQWGITLILLRSVGMLLTWLYILRQIEQVLTSVEQLKTFHVDNISTFRKLGFASLLLALLDLIRILPTADGFTLTLTLGLSYFAMAVAAFLLSEVFREGNELYEQNRLMI